ncbi:MAG: Poly-beta-1,6-N-acetyl-D-glucosamine synthase [Syntrophorhabdus sp. PtaB.Bin027]|nr:MAG: Poly-beta-1,6-N-acetyl-D-glucosamine synthase [Syntrophorhabdus sp. PtaB.Bin027]
MVCGELGVYREECGILIKYYMFKKKMVQALNISGNPNISVIIVIYNQKQYLESCIESIFAQELDFEIIIIDNSSTDGSYEFIKGKYPKIRIFRNLENIGYAAANNFGVKMAKGEIVVIINPDTKVGKKWLITLIKPLLKHDKLITTSKILMYDGSKINTCGNKIHFSGLAFTNGFGQNPSAFSTSFFVEGISGCCFAMKKYNYFEIGGFNENFFLYSEDTEFSWKLHLMNYRIKLVTESIVYHDYHLKLSAQKLYNLEKGRYLILREMLNLNDIFLLSPSLLIIEILTLIFSFNFGIVGVEKKIFAIRDSFNIKIEKIQGNKQNLINNFCYTIPSHLGIEKKHEEVVKKILNVIFETNGIFLKKFYRLGD